MYENFKAKYVLFNTFFGQSPLFLTYINLNPSMAK